MKLTQQTDVTIGEKDMLAMLTEKFCERYGLFENLQAVSLNQTEAGDFEVTFELKPQEETPDA